MCLFIIGALLQLVDRRRRNGAAGVSPATEKQKITCRCKAEATDTAAATDNLKNDMDRCPINMHNHKKSIPLAIVPSIA